MNGKPSPTNQTQIESSQRKKPSRGGTQFDGHQKGEDKFDLLSSKEDLFGRDSYERISTT